MAELETMVCSRCGGSGQYSYCQMYGKTCFKCHGRGRVYTKRGAAAAAFLKASRSKRAADFLPGDLVFLDCVFSGAKFRRVNGLRPVPGRTSIMVETDSLASEHAPDELLRRGCTKEEKAETLRAALAYQDTLAKSGKPRKRADSTTLALFA